MFAPCRSDGRMSHALRAAGTPEDTGERVRTDETGGIVTGWLFQLVLVMLVVGVVIHEAVAVTATSFQVDTDAQEVAEAAAGAYGSPTDLPAATLAAEQIAARRGVEVVDVAQLDQQVVVRVSKSAKTLLLHRIGPLADLTTATATARSRWTP
jgi:hypothetical protein